MSSPPTLGHWPRILFGTILRIPLLVSSRFRGTGLRITLRGLSSLRFPLGLVFPEDTNPRKRTFIITPIPA